MNIIHNMNMIYQTGAELTPRRRRRRAARVDQILDTAMRLLSENGLEALTMHRLARELDYVPGTLYRYFASKDALLAALQRRTIAQLHASFQSARNEWRQGRGRCHLTGEQFALFELLSAANFYMELSSVMPAQFRLVSLLLGDPRELISQPEAKKAAQPLLDFLQEVRVLFEAATQLKALCSGDTLERTVVLWASLQGVIQLDKISRLEPQLFSARRLVPILVQGLLSGWGADDSDLKQAIGELERVSPRDK